MPDENAGRRKAVCFLAALNALADLKEELLNEEQGPNHREWIARIDAFTEDLLTAVEAPKAAQ